jgi:hypothetical protein
VTVVARGGKWTSLVPIGPHDAIEERLVAADIGVVVTDGRGAVAATGSAGRVFPF